MLVFEGIKELVEEGLNKGVYILLEVKGEMDGIIIVMGFEVKLVMDI